MRGRLLCSKRFAAVRIRINKKIFQLSEDTLFGSRGELYIMKEKDVLEICSAVMMQGDDAVFRGLAVMGEMMDAVVNSDLCGKAGARFPLGEAILRTDEVKAEFSRDEMLAGTSKRSGDFAVVPKVIE